jgi:hypothetical protein
LPIASGRRNLSATPLVELDVMRSDDHAHAADSEHALDTVLAGEDVSLAYSGGGA